MFRANSLQDLKQIRKHLAAERAKAEREARQQALRRRHQSAELNLFAHAMQGVTPLHAPARALRPAARPQPLPRQRWLDDKAALQESLSDDFDPATLLQVDGQLSYRRPGMGPDVPARLRRGHWAVQAELDLHGLRRDEAREALGRFLREAHAAGLRCVRVIHGKGLGSPGRVPVLKGRVHSWLVQKRVVLAFTQARPTQGGAGALLVLLERAKGPKRRG